VVRRRPMRARQVPGGLRGSESSGPLGHARWDPRPAPNGSCTVKRDPAFVPAGRHALTERFRHRTGALDYLSQS
jgi:hypothetical protein